MKLYSKYTLWVLSSIFICSCNVKQNPNVDYQKLKEEMSTHKPTIVKENEIMNLVSILGDSISKQIETKLDSYDNNCDYEGLTEFISKKSPQISKIHVICDRPINALYQSEVDIWDAYKYSEKNKLSFNNNIQSISDSLFLFSNPIVKKDSLQSLINIFFIKNELVKTIQLQKNKKK